MNVFEHLHQKKIFDLHLFGADISITNLALNGFLAASAVLLFYYFAGRRAKKIPSSFQIMAESVVQFVESEMLAPLGKERDAWVPFIVSLFSFILVSNLLGLIPGLLPPTSN